MTARRTFLAAAGQLGLAGVLAGCAVVERRVPVEPRDDGPRRGGADLSARPGGTVPAGPAAPGEHELGVVPERDTLLHVPPGVEGPLPLVVSLHGAGGSARGGLDLLKSAATEHGFAVLAPSSRGSTWDAVRGGYGPDADVLDRSLRRAFELVQVDPERVAVAGFSDGASYALGLGLANGDLFGGVVAFSPGFVPPGGRTGTPRVFVSHGTGDEVLPVERTSRRIVPRLRDDGYDVVYAEFDGGHAVPPQIVRRAVAWLGW
jgi:phospholipase/carboxylesterase